MIGEKKATCQGSDSRRLVRQFPGHDDLKFPDRWPNLKRVLRNFSNRWLRGELGGCSKYVQDIKCKHEMLAQLLLAQIIVIFTKYDRVVTRIRRCREFDEQALQEKTTNRHYIN